MRDREVMIRGYGEQDLPALVALWNEVVEEGVAFPQEEALSLAEGQRFFASQSHTAVAVDGSGQVLGLYILHPNNVGRCGHIANASFAVAKDVQGQHIGGRLVRDCLDKARELGFRILQFNAVVDQNHAARQLYQQLGFQELGTIPQGFRMKDGHYEDIHVMYYDLWRG